MFVIDETAAQTAITVLSILKSISVIHGSGFAANEMPVETGWDTVHGLYYRAIDLSADKVRYRFFEGAASEVIRLMDANLTDYYRFAYIFGDLKSLKDSENPYLADAEETTRVTVGSIGHYSFDAWLKVSRRCKPRLYLFHYPEFYPNGQVIYELYQFFLFYKKALPLLQSELRALKKSKGLKRLPYIPKINERKAA
ncbi:MAG: hypothetical protein FWD48_04070 [Oscillospiraceae bacterium]|nr:hypothetical protein [Oscillospiraceae bacterium]